MWTVKTIYKKENFNVLPRKLPEMGWFCGASWLSPPPFVKIWKIWTKKTKEDAFYTNLEFGTAGMRGLIGAGTNRINIYVVRQATEGLARFDWVQKVENEKERGVAIA